MGCFPTQIEVSERGSVSCLSFPSFEDLFFSKGIVSLSIDRPTDENTCRVELHFLKQSRVKNMTGHQISHVLLWFLSTGYCSFFTNQSPVEPKIRCYLFIREKEPGDRENGTEKEGAA